MGLELANLRTIRTQKQQLAGNIATQLSLAKEMHDGIQARYNKLLREMEAIYSELTISRDYVSMLEKQQQKLREEDEELAGLLHPIRRYPDDILRIIFEYATYTKTFQTATKISQVCKLWRAVALSMGSLWKHVSISVRDDIERVRELMERTYIRARSSPLEMDIMDIGTKPVEITRALFECLKLDRFEVIDYLFLSLASSKDIIHLSPITINSLASTKSIYIIPSSGPFELPAWDCTWLLKQLKVEELNLFSLGPILLTGDDPIPSLCKLHISNIIMPTLALQLSRLTGLIDLDISGDYSLDTVTQDIDMPRLLMLTVAIVRSFPWDRLAAPQLQTITTDDKDLRVVPFLCQHPSIRELRLDGWITAEGFNNLAVHLVNVEKLSINGNIAALFKQVETRVPFPPFPKLTDLTMCLGDGFFLSPQDVENFVKTRSPLGRLKEQNDIGPVTQWKIKGPTNLLEDASWRTSPLLENYQQTLRTYRHLSIATLFLRWSPQ